MSTQERRALAFALHDWRERAFFRYAPRDPGSWYRALVGRHQWVLDGFTPLEELIQ